nr:WASH complex subunit 4 isoform X2 [Drosophila bipectinata]
MYVAIYAGDILKSYGLFIEEHDETLKKLKKKTPGFSETKNNSLISMISVIELNYVFNDSIVAQMFLEESQMVANKPLTTLANLCNQCRDLTRTAKELQLTWLLTGSKLKDQKQHLGYDLAKLEQILFRISTSIDFFCRVNFTLNRINETVQNLWTQIVAVSVLEEINELHIFTLFDYMNELLESVVVFNEIVERSYIASIWVLYKNWLATLTNNKCILDHCTTLELLGLSKALKEIESVISGNLFRTLLAHLMKLKNQTCLKDVNRITQRSNAYIRKKVFAVDINQDTEYTNIEDPKLIIRVIAFVVTIQQLGIQIEAKLVKAIFDLVTKHQLLPLIGKFRWSPHKFILEHSKTLFKTSGRFHAITGNGNKIQTSIIEKIKLNDLKTSRLLGNQIAVWSFNLKKVTDSGIFGHFKMLYNLLLSGHSYIDEICVLTNSLINRHIALRSSLVKADISLICRLLQYLMIIQDIFETNQINFIRFLDSLIQWQKQKVLFLLQNTKKKILDIKLVQRKANLLSIIKLTENIFVGFPSTKRLTFLNLALGDFLDKDRLQIGDKHNYFSSFLFRANNLGRFKQECRMKVDSSILIYILWLQNTSFFREYVELQRNSYSMQNIVAVSQQLQKSRHIFTGCEDNKHSPNTLMIEFLKLHFEFFLRVEALSHFFQNQDEPFQKQRLDYRLCLTSTASEFLGSYDIIRDNLENYLTETFYNVTTIAPHDWKSYEKMRYLANKVLLLSPIDDHLPNQIIDQGIDVLKIMRNIHTFASSYAYNMNLQLFVEMQSNGKHLEIISTRHVSNSVQTHGTGIINTTVNFIYQFLRQKFYTFSTFLHDEQIKSRLLKELRFHLANKHGEKYHSYPYERSENILKKIKKLGLSTNGETYMDLFRKVITQVGNAVGYVRLLQAGSKNSNYRSRSYMSIYENNFNSAGPRGMHTVTENSIGEYGKNVGHMKECYSDCTNYFKLLLLGFKPFLCNPNNHHLKTFFLITPAVITNYIEYRVKEKLKVHKKDQTNSSVFEDGFAIGLIYILCMLNQLGDFHELSWSKSTANQLYAERSKVTSIVEGQKVSAGHVDEKLLQTVAITERHVNAYEHEYNLLYATLSSAEIFFQ